MGGGVAEIVQRPVRSERAVRPVEHRPGGVVTERPARAPKGPPQWLVAARRHVVELDLVEAEPDEGIRRCRHLLEGAAALADDGDELLAGIGVADRGAEQLGCPHPARYVEGDERPVTV